MSIVGDISTVRSVSSVSNSSVSSLCNRKKNVNIQNYLNNNDDNNNKIFFKY